MDNRTVQTMGADNAERLLTLYAKQMVAANSMQMMVDYAATPMEAAPYLMTARNEFLRRWRAR